MFAILKKELKSYFLSPVGYVVIGIFLLVFSLFFYLTAIGSGTVDLGGLYYYTALYGLIIIAPILTMRMFAEERKNGTEQLILTAPVNIFGIIMGKLLAAIGVILVTLVISLMYFFIVMCFGTPHITPLLAQILGFILISTAAISVGMFASSITENQIVSGIITIAFLILTLFIGNINKNLGNLSLIKYYDNFANGIISLNNVIALVSFSVVFILLTTIVMQRRKLVK